MTVQVESNKKGLIPDAINEIGGLVTFAAQTFLTGLAAILKRRFPLAEFVSQTTFLVKVCFWPSLLLMLPIGVVIAVMMGGLAGRVGAAQYSGAVVSFVIIGQAAALVTALIAAGVGGAAICSDLGARTIREEIDALQVMSVDVVERVVVPRVFALVFVALSMCTIVSFAGIFFTYTYQVVGVGESQGGFLLTLQAYGRTSDFVMALFKSFCFGVACSIVAAYKGTQTRGGSAGVANSVNDAVVMMFIAVFVINVVLTQMYIVVVPAVGDYI
ncbi:MULTISPECIES: MlaE family ABC transporter permease [Hoyosella]|uniref:YrbE family protein n=2 Tax=Hoyosella TaxID=697025 RepID=F6EHS0_HOYSD|nr:MULTISPECIES: ABC transporter permease [Hoyosella]AEF38868.1 hypothetical protein AS9A_0409 [Hoyosella subflava DQS3-9A1]MBB3037693.1 phospholipid/cholesterol/gamma-HCH transport system permease protein [Hoyosella altamirensis]